MLPPLLLPVHYSSRGNRVHCNLRSPPPIHPPPLHPSPSTGVVCWICRLEKRAKKKSKKERKERTR
ncbi:hypothetical protein PIB30_110062, partial [Stylosanthes scabra]|nr:hypothetical protein [Stylosanthes scabra]